jgi:hypothetical protein
LLPLLSRKDYRLLKKLYLNWDAVNNGWNQWVLGYDQQKQLSLLSTIMGKKIAWGDIGLILVFALIGLMLVISYFLLRNKAVVLDPIKKTYQQFLRKLEKAGILKPAYEGAINFGERAAKKLPEKATEIQEISSLFSSLQYAKPENSSNENTMKQQRSLYLLKQLVKSFKVK